MTYLWFGLTWLWNLCAIIGALAIWCAIAMWVKTRREDRQRGLM